MAGANKLKNLSQLEKRVEAMQVEFQKLDTKKVRLPEKLDSLNSETIGPSMTVFGILPQPPGSDKDKK